MSRRLELKTLSVVLCTIDIYNSKSKRRYNETAVVLACCVSCSCDLHNDVRSSFTGQRATSQTAAGDAAVLSFQAQFRAHKLAAGSTEEHAQRREMKVVPLGRRTTTKPALTISRRNRSLSVFSI